MFNNYDKVMLENKRLEHFLNGVKITVNKQNRNIQNI